MVPSVVEAYWPIEVRQALHIRTEAGFRHMTRIGQRCCRQEAARMTNLGLKPEFPLFSNPQPMDKASISLLHVVELYAGAMTRVLVSQEKLKEPSTALVSQLFERV